MYALRYGAFDLREVPWKAYDTESGSPRKESQLTVLVWVVPCSDSVPEQFYQITF